MKTPTRVLSGLLILVSVTLIGCAGPSFGFSASERAHTYKTITESEWRMTKDDMDNWWMMDRRSRLTRWH